MNVMGPQGAFAFVGGAGDGKRLTPSVALRASSEQTGGLFELFEVTGPFAPPPHVHRDREELSYVVQGRFQFVLGDDRLRVQAGSVVLASRGTPHGLTAGPDARLLVFVAPAGLEAFFEEFGKGLAAGKTPQEIIPLIARKYDSEPVTPATKEPH
jgi:mannose-6-phosphate isomerase-like protein (cupin superfamily)